METNGHCGGTRIFLAAALGNNFIEAERDVGRRRIWQPADTRQEGFLHYLNAARESRKRLGDLPCFAKRCPQSAATFFRGNGISLDMGDDSVGKMIFGAHYYCNVCWSTPGSEGPLLHGVYPSVRMPATAVDFFRACHGHPVARLETVGHGTVFMTHWDGPSYDLDMLHAVFEIETTLEPDPGRPDLVFPMIKCIRQFEIPRFAGISTVDGAGVRCELGRIIHRVQLRLSPDGYKNGADEPVLRLNGAGSGRRAASSQPHVFDKAPLFLWSRRDGVELPMLIAKLDRDVWQDPCSLKKPVPA